MASIHYGETVSLLTQLSFECDAWHDAGLENLKQGATWNG